jgi:hypothetical protein
LKCTHVNVKLNGTEQWCPVQGDFCISEVFFLINVLTEYTFAVYWGRSVNHIVNT